MLSPFSALNKALNVKGGACVNVVVKYSIIIRKFAIRYDPYINMYHIHYFIGTDLLKKYETMKFLLNMDIMSINVCKNNIIKLCYIKGTAVILRCYRKYKLRTAKIKNDLVIRGLSERWYHPSRISFEC